MHYSTCMYIMLKLNGRAIHLSNVLREDNPCKTMFLLQKLPVSTT